MNTNLERAGYTILEAIKYKDEARLLHLQEQFIAAIDGCVERQKNLGANSSTNIAATNAALLSAMLGLPIEDSVTKSKTLTQMGLEILAGSPNPLYTTLGLIAKKDVENLRKVSLALESIRCYLCYEAYYATKSGWCETRNATGVAALADMDLSKFIQFAEHAVSLNTPDDTSTTGETAGYDGTTKDNFFARSKAPYDDAEELLDDVFYPLVLLTKVDGKEFGMLCTFTRKVGENWQSKLCNNWADVEDYVANK